MTTSSRRTLALGLKTGPFPSSGVQMPEVVVMVESTLLGRREFACTNGLAKAQAIAYV